MFDLRTHPLVVLCTAFCMMACPRVRAQTCVTPSNEACPGATSFVEADLPLNTSGVYGCEDNTIPFSDMPFWDVYYRYDCTCTGFYDVDMCDSTADAALRIYIDGCGFAAGDELIEGDDECLGSPPSADPMVTVLLEAGRSYWFELGTWRVNPPWGPSEPNAPFSFNVSECNPCGSGDVNGDGQVDGQDIPGFVNQLVNPPASFGAAACAADMSVNLSVGTEDVVMFVEALVGA
ncbi:MAG: hypothetical protein MI923_00780 [Phycisphaerales bacterium]|nr:hypothetical protein [Phycisphaerales bacterium]